MDKQQEQSRPDLPSQGGQIQVKAGDEVLKGQYATMAEASSGSEEFKLDFFNLMPPVPQMVARIIVSPSHFKRLLKAMESSLEQYEQQFGVIQLQVTSDMKVNFDLGNKSAKEK
jgi:hypothetical protein